MANIKDVAKASGVSKTTVSYVLNNGPRYVSPSTRARVLEVMHNLNYHPSGVARGLSRKRMNTIGVVTLASVSSPLLDPYYLPIINGIIDAATPEMQSVTLFNGNVWDLEHSRFPIFCDGRCDGLLIFIPPEGNPVIPVLKDQRIPFVVLNESGNDPEVSSIDIDNVYVSCEMVTYLISKGHRRIACFAGSLGLHFGRERLEGYRLALGKAGIPFDPKLVMPCERGFAAGYEKARGEFASFSQRPTAIFASEDMIALGAMTGLAEQGIRVPTDVSVVGIDYIEDAKKSTPPLTTMSQHLNRLGETAVDMLMELIASGGTKILKCVQPTELVIGGTVSTVVGASPISDGPTAQ